MNAVNQASRSQFGIIVALFALLMLAASLLTVAGQVAQIITYLFVIGISTALAWFACRRAELRFRGITMILGTLATVIAILNLIFW